MLFARLMMRTERMMDIVLSPIFLSSMFLKETS